MSDSLPTVWPADPHTLAKHGILRRYPVRMLFIELDKNRFTHLQAVLAPYIERARESSNIHAVEPRQGECDQVLNAMLDESEKSHVKFGPALAFLDQFGYGDVSMELIRRIMSYPQCEVFTYVNYKDMNRWFADRAKDGARNRAFGGEEWRTCDNLEDKAKREELLRLYKVALHDRDRGNVKYVASFLMFDRMGVPLYWLLFCTNSLRGLEEMKKAMWKIDKSGEFRFSDKDNPGQLRLLEESFDQKWLAGELQVRLAGRTMSAMEVKEYVLVETPCCLFKEALKSLESKGIATMVGAPPRRRPGTFPEDRIAQIRIRFSENLFPT